jgi:hypothetical protein
MSTAKNERYTCRIKRRVNSLLPFAGIISSPFSRVRVKYQHGTISVSIPGIFLKLHNNNYTHIPYIRYELGCDQPIMETLLEKQ